MSYSNATSSGRKVLEYTWSVHICVWLPESEFWEATGCCIQHLGRGRARWYWGISRPHMILTSDRGFTQPSHMIKVVEAVRNDNSKAQVAPEVDGLVQCVTRCKRAMVGATYCVSNIHHTTRECVSRRARLSNSRLGMMRLLSSKAILIYIRLRRLKLATYLRTNMSRM